MQLEALNESFLTVHGRTRSEKSTIFNDDVMPLDDANKFYEHTKCNGFMSARHILSNPGLFWKCKNFNLN